MTNDNQKIVQEKSRWARRSQKVFCVPKLPRKIDAMYDNVCRGNLGAYYLDPNPAREDPAYIKLGKLKAKYSWDNPNGSERVAGHLMDDIIARQMGEKTYNHIRRMPLCLLRLEFAVKHETDRTLRKEINERLEYMFRNEEKEWID